MRENTSYYIGLDLALVNDFSAIAIIERRYEEEEDYFEKFKKPFFNLTYLERFQIPYPEVVRKIKVLFQDRRLQEGGSLIVDSTGLGAPVISMLKEDGLKPVSVVITAGDVSSQTKDGFHVPRTHIIGTLAAAFGSSRLKIAADLKLAGVFTEELENLAYKIRREDGAMTYETMSEKIHDDLCMSSAIALWVASRDGFQRRKQFHKRRTHYDLGNPMGWDE